MSEKVFIKRAVLVELVCDCGETFACFEPTQRVGLGNADAEGWQIAIHRKGESTVVCPECAERAEKERVRRIAGRILAKQKKVNALAEYQQEMAALKSGEEKET